jgi:putative membrane-bound dehydrogenase-like protein
VNWRTNLYQIAVLSLSIVLVPPTSVVSGDETWQPRNSQQTGKHPPSPQESLARLRVPRGFQVTLAAAEPDVRQPIAIAFDDRGRLWVAESYSYDGSDFTTEQRDRILIFDDTDGDGVFDQRKVFCDGLNRLTGLTIGFGGVWITSPPNLSFIPDRNADDRPDSQAIVQLDGWSIAAEHNSVNGLTWGPDGWLYGRHGIKQPSLVGRPGDKEQDRIGLSCCIWRYHPTRLTFEVVTDGTVNPWGLDFDDYGHAFLTTSVVEHLWHVVPGARLSRRKGRDAHPNPYSYELMESTSDHLHWGNLSFEKQVRVAAGNEAFGGGHSHCDAMIYLGDRWPKRYRGSVFMSNIHGRRINCDHFQRDHGGQFVAVHDDDFLVSSDPWFRAVSMEYGPDGDMYVTDWSDLGECHDRDGIHRTSGRIYKVSWGVPRHVPVDLTAESDQRLVDFQLHENDWFVRHARRLLQERAALGNSMRQVHRQLHAMFQDQSDISRKLRILWALHVTDGLSVDWLLRQLDAEHEQIRAWAVRLLVDDQAVRHDLSSQFARLASSESSWLVRMELASALQRLPHAQRWPIARALATDRSSLQDLNLVRMVWYGLEPVVATDPARALSLVEANVAPKIRRFVARRISDQMDQSPRAAELLFTAIRGTKTSDRLAELLNGMNESLMRNRRNTSGGPLNDVLSSWIRHEDPQLRRAAVTSAMILGDNALVSRVSQLVHNRDLDPATRLAVLQGLVARRPTQLGDDLRRLIQADQFVQQSLLAAAAIADSKLTDVILARYDQLDQAEKRLAVDAVISRPTSAARLLDAIEGNRIPARDVSAGQARQIVALRDKSLIERLEKVWGSLNSTTKEKRGQIASLKRSLRPDLLSSADLQRGRKLFQKQCGVCHRLFGEGQTVAPDLTGSGRRNVDYLLQNIVDPNAVVPADFRISLIHLVDGRVVTGSVISTTDQTLTVQSRTERLFLQRNEIEVVKATSTSLMPEGLLKELDISEIQDLFGYLMSAGPDR